MGGAREPEHSRVQWGWTESRWGVYGRKATKDGLDIEVDGPQTWEFAEEAKVEERIDLFVLRYVYPERQPTDAGEGFAKCLENRLINETGMC